MQKVSIRDRMDSALSSETTTPEDKKLVEEQLRGNLPIVTQQASRQYLAFLAFAVTFTLLVLTDLPKLSVAGVEVARENPAVLLLPVLAAFAWYRSLSLFAFGSLIKSALFAFYDQELPAFHSCELTELFTYPSFLEVETAYVNLFERWTSGVSTLFTVTIGLVAALLPIIWFWIASEWVLFEVSAHIAVRVSSLILIWLSVVRAITLTVQWVTKV